MGCSTRWKWMSDDLLLMTGSEMTGELIDEVRRQTDPAYYEKTTSRGGSLLWFPSQLLALTLVQRGSLCLLLARGCWEGDGHTGAVWTAPLLPLSRFLSPSPLPLWCCADGYAILFLVIESEWKIQCNKVLLAAQVHRLNFFMWL